MRRCKKPNEFKAPGVMGGLAATTLTGFFCQRSQLSAKLAGQIGSD